ncbi:MAG: MFS transporter [Lachnospiraceae bacterium]|nr:MFS transporter [Lachnospiraceae bacterium]MDY5870153.1 MFS transporter [Lachnospiraceae bacterium]
MKKFMMIWIGELISSIGSGMTAFALSIYVYEMTGSVSYVSLVTLLAYLPTILLSPLGGVLADRYDRRILMIIGDLFSGLGLLYILWQIQVGAGSMLPILIGVTFNAVFVALLEPSYRATITDLLTQEEYDRASGMVQMAGNARYLLSPALAGILLAVADIRLILVLDISTFFITITMVALVRKTIQKPVKRETQGFLTEMKQGFTVITENKGILSLVIIMAFVCFFIGFVQTLTGPMVLAVSDARTVGILESVCAIGMLVGSVWIGFVGIRGGYARVLCGAGIFCGVFMALAGVNRNLWVTGIGIFLFFLSLPFMNTCADVLVRVNIPNELQGRVWGMISLLTQAGTVLAYASCGVLADYLFEPMLAEKGILAGSVGRLIGTGEGRGIGFLLILSGIGMALCASTIGHSRGVRALQKNLEEQKEKEHVLKASEK